MRHYILVQFNDRAPDRARAEEEIRALFTPAVEIQGVHSVAVVPAAVSGSNRYDLLICVEMEREALSAFDASDIHRRWKEAYGPLIAQKGVFDG